MIYLRGSIRRGCSCNIMLSQPNLEIWNTNTEPTKTLQHQCKPIEPHTAYMIDENHAYTATIIIQPHEYEGRLAPSAHRPNFVNRLDLSARKLVKHLQYFSCYYKPTNKSASRQECEGGEGPSI